MKTLYTGLTSPQADYIHTPLIEVRPVDNDAAIQQAAARIDSYDYMLYTSRHAAAYVAPLMTKARRTVSIGKATTAALHQAGIACVSEVDEDNSYGVIAWFDSQPRGRVLIPRSDLALPIIPEGLQKLGFEVDCVTVYTNSMPAHPQKVELTDIGRIVFTSPSTIDNFIRLYGRLPLDKELTTRGPITEQHLQNMIKKQLL